ncbi:MAG: allantoinase, partial [bacterium]
MSFDLVVRGGHVVTPAGTLVANVGIAAGRVATIQQDELSGHEVIDARGLVVLPGAVDLHVHFNEPGRTHWEGWGPGSPSA